MKFGKLVAALSIAQSVSAGPGPNWPGFSGLRYWFVFGDSYTTVGFNSRSPTPNDRNPLGVTYPGQTTSAGPNWVGYVTTAYNQSKIWTFDYAISGNQVDGVRQQIADYMPAAGSKPSYAPWKGSDTLHTVWIGINDLNFGANPSNAINSLFGLQDNLYTNGARNFLFVNVPPFHRAPFGNNNQDLNNRINGWNTQLQTAIAGFQSKYSDVSTFYYDSYSLYTKLLNNPSQYGFTDTNQSGGSFWADVIHPKAKVHDYMAQDLVAFLKAQTGAQPTEPPVTSPPITTPPITSPPITTPTPTPTPTQPPAPVVTQIKYGQCGGQGWTGPTICADGSTCTFLNQWYSQCL